VGAEEHQHQPVLATACGSSSVRVNDIPAPSSRSQRGKVLDQRKDPVYEKKTDKTSGSRSPVMSLHRLPLPGHRQ